MDILGVGFSELIFVLIIALMVFGPRRLPEIAGKLGRYVAQLRSLSDGLMAEWQREINAATQLEELQKARQDIKDIQEDLKRTKSDLNQAKKDVDEGTKSIAPKAQPRTSIPSNPAIVQVKPPAADSPTESDNSDTSNSEAPIEADELPSSSNNDASVELSSSEKRENSEPSSSVSAEETESQIPPSKNGTTPITSSKSQEV
ncbi:MAG: twin-arginine translocase TatA/TatE family subunit [Anaerolineae bacterium]|nr:twin-arginine translocase TatA/TatE family subunit [Anaerolineae bacterium]